MRSPVPLLVLVALPATSALAGSGASFIPIPGTDGLFDGVSDLTPDGSVVVGTTSAQGAFYWRWRDEPSPVFLGGMSASAISDDGSVIAGNIVNPDTGAETAALWTQETGWQSLGGADQCDFIHSSAWDMSGDGSIVVGLTWDGCRARGFRWTMSTGMELLEELGDSHNRASVISTDGQVIGGFAQGSFSRTPAVWPSNGAGTLFDIDARGEVNGVNADGSMLTGTYEGEAFYWTESAGVVGIGTLTQDPFYSAVGRGISDQGTIVGFDKYQYPTEAWLWTEEDGLVSLQQLLTELGVAAVPTLQVGWDISADGRTIVGHTFGGTGWIVSLPGGCMSDLDGNGDVGFGDVVMIIASWGPCPDGSNCAEDLDRDNDVDFDDLLTVLSMWGTCP